MILGLCSLPSGKIIAADPLVYLGTNNIAPYYLSVPSGEYRTEIAVIKSDGTDCARYAAARLRFSDKRAVKFYEALTGLEDLSEAEEGCFFGFPVDAGMGCFCDAAVNEEYREWAIQWNREHPDGNIYDDYFSALFEESYKKYPEFQREGGDWINRTVPGTEHYIPFFQSGFGDGCYPVYWGVDEKGDICQIVIQFIDIELAYGNEEENEEYIPAVPSRDINEIIEKLERADKTADDFDYEISMLFCDIIVNCHDADYELTDKNEIIHIFSALWDWYCGGTENGTWQYYERRSDSDHEKMIPVLTEYGGEKFAEMYKNGIFYPAEYDNIPSRYPDEKMDSCHKTDRFIVENEIETLDIIRRYVIDNKDEFIRIFGNSGFLSAEEINSLGMEKMIGENPEIAEFIENAKKEAMASFKAMMRSGCDVCANRLDNNAANELCCKAYPDGVPESVLLAPAESKLSGCADGFRFEEE